MAFKKYTHVYHENTKANPRNHVRYSDYLQFLADFAAGKYETQRLGQAFYNRFDSTTDPFPVLFFETNNEKALDLIVTSYKIWMDDNIPESKAMDQS